MISLHYLAEEGKLPIHQNIDIETLEWIKKNQPQNFKNIDYSEISNTIDIDVISKFVSDESWFTSKNKVNSLHGIRHLLRVTTYSYYLSNSINNLIERNSLLLASYLHDIRRKTDQGDKGHSKHGADWYLKHKKSILKKINLENVNHALVNRLIEEHESSTHTNFNLLNNLKTADALDRYIQPKKKWWINEEYLEIIPSTALKAFAFNLVIQSEEKYLKGVTSKLSVIDSLKEMQN